MSQSTHQHGEAECREVLAQLDAYLDGEATPEGLAALEAHMADCEPCRVVAGTLRHMVQLYHAQPQPTWPAEARARLYAALDLGECAPGEDEGVRG